MVELIALYGDGESQEKMVFDLPVDRRDQRWVKGTRMSWEPPNYSPANVTKAWCTITATVDGNGKVIWRRTSPLHDLELNDPKTLY